MPVFTSGGSQVGSEQINDDSIVNADINSAAGIERRKLADGLLVKATATSNAAFSSQAQVVFDVEVVDTLNAFSSNAFTAPRDMEVLVIVNLPIAQGGSTDRNAIVELHVNGTAVRRCGGGVPGGTSSTAGMNLIEKLTLAENDVLDVEVSASGAGLSLIGGSNNRCLTIYEV